MKNRNLLEELMDKYLKSKLTITERRQFNDLLTDDVNEEVFKEIIHEHANDFTELYSISDSNVDFDKIYCNILTHLKTNHDITPKRSLPEKLVYILTAAAVVTAVFFLGRVLPGSKSENKVISQAVYTEIKSPYGSKSEIKLPDGTTVILNAGSSLKYSNDFSITNRDINLYGEAYFKVAKNALIPLVVSTGYIDVIAVGTEFNVKAYPDENIIETTLINGKVEISNHSSDEELVDLNPNQKAIFYKDKEEYKFEKSTERVTQPDQIKTNNKNILIAPQADVQKSVAWTEGRLIFHGETLGNLCIDLQRKYDVKFVCAEENLKKYRFTGVLLDETIEQVLNVIKLSSSIDYSLEGKTVYLFKGVNQHEVFQKQMDERKLLIQDN